MKFLIKKLENAGFKLDWKNPNYWVMINLLSLFMFGIYFGLTFSEIVDLNDWKHLWMFRGLIIYYIIFQNYFGFKENLKKAKEEIKHSQPSS